MLPPARVGNLTIPRPWEIIPRMTFLKNSIKLSPNIHLSRLTRLKSKIQKGDTACKFLIYISEQRSKISVVIQKYPVPSKTKFVMNISEKKKKITGHPKKQENVIHNKEKNQLPETDLEMEKKIE